MNKRELWKGNKMVETMTKRSRLRHHERHAYKTEQLLIPLDKDFRAFKLLQSDHK
jgi:hypothetical protein